MDHLDGKPRLLTGDTPTGRLHLGHLVGSLENRLKFQETHECYFIIADKHAFTTRADRPGDVRAGVIEVATDWLAVGLDPLRSALFVQSAVPAIDQLTVDFSMLIPFNRVMRNPTLKQEIREKGLGDSYPFGFPLYAVGQTADILAFRPAVVPVGRDQVPHLELTREVARRYNQLYRGVAPHAADADQAARGGLFPVVEPILGRVDKLVGVGPPGPDGNLPKMSKSLDNAVFLSDGPDEVRRKIMGMYTDPGRVRATDPGRVEGNPLWAFHEAFNPDRAWVDEHEDLYRRGMVGDAAVKRRLVEVLDGILAPIRGRRASFEARPGDVIDALREGTRRANLVAEETLAAVKRDLRRDDFAAAGLATA